jgi:myo-inositol-1(or 4)-monophosphatase
LGKRKVYIVDPLDGSGDLKRGEDDFCVQIALAEDGEVVLGVVYEPSKKRLFSGQKGWQALLAQDVTLRGDDTYDASEGVLSPLKPVAWQDAIVGHPKSYKGDKYQQLYKWLCIPESRLRKSGSMGTRMMQVALGETHMILGYTRSLNEWDVAAGHAVLEARGMSVTDVQGNPVRYNKGIPKTGNGILVAHPDIKWDLLHHIKGCLPLVPL